MGNLVWSFFLVLLGSIVTLVVPSVDEGLHYYEANGVVCNKCPPGTKVVKHCTVDLTNSSCEVCPDHKYVDHWNDKTHCLPCKSSCPKNGKAVQDCTPTTNHQCRCDLGFHRHPLDPIDNHWKCREHAQCPEGYRVKDYGNHSHDTSCEKCREGEQFVNTSDTDRPQCEACSVCANGSVVLSKCTPTSDTVCRLNISKNSTDNATDNATTEEPVTRGDDSSGLSGGGIAGIVVGVLIFIFLTIPGIVLYIVWYRRRKKQQGSPANGDMRPGAGEQEMPMIGN